MTSTVIIRAHCSANKEVKVKIDDGDAAESFTLQDGESAERYIYDDREISVKEVLKQTTDKE